MAQLRVFGPSIVPHLPPRPSIRGAGHAPRAPLFTACDSVLWGACERRDRRDPDGTVEGCGWGMGYRTLQGPSRWVRWIALWKWFDNARSSSESTLFPATRASRSACGRLSTVWLAVNRSGSRHRALSAWPAQQLRPGTRGRPQVPLVRITVTVQPPHRPYCEKLADARDTFRERRPNPPRDRGMTECRAGPSCARSVRSATSLPFASSITSKARPPPPPAGTARSQWDRSGRRRAQLRHDDARETLRPARTLRSSRSRRGDEYGSWACSARARWRARLRVRLCRSNPESLQWWCRGPRPHAALRDRPVPTSDVLKASSSFSMTRRARALGDSRSSPARKRSHAARLPPAVPPTCSTTTASAPSPSRRGAMPAPRVLRQPRPARGRRPVGTVYRPGCEEADLACAHHLPDCRQLLGHSSTWRGTAASPGGSRRAPTRRQPVHPDVVAVEVVKNRAKARERVAQMRTRRPNGACRGTAARRPPAP